jgi:DMSO reductase anchor subunit
MAQVYQLRSIPAWDTKRTLLAFIVSAIVLGGLGLGVVNAFGSASAKSGYLIVSGIGLIGALLLSLFYRHQAHQSASRLRFSLIVLALFGVVTILLIPDSIGMRMVSLIFILALSEEVIGRMLFYKHLHRRIL